MSSSVDELQEIAAVSVSLRVAVVATAGICEEFIYRSFAIEELTFLTGKRWLSAALAGVFFTVAHVRLYDLSGALIVPGTLGAVLTALYLWRRNLASRLPCDARRADVPYREAVARHLAIGRRVLSNRLGGPADHGPRTTVSLLSTL